MIVHERRDDRRPRTSSPTGAPAGHREQLGRCRHGPSRPAAPEGDPRPAARVRGGGTRVTGERSRRESTRSRRRASTCRTCPVVWTSGARAAARRGSPRSPTPTARTRNVACASTEAGKLSTLPARRDASTQPSTVTSTFAVVRRDDGDLRAGANRDDGVFHRVRRGPSAAAVSGVCARAGRRHRRRRELRERRERHERHGPGECGECRMERTVRIAGSEAALPDSFHSRKLPSYPSPGHDGASRKSTKSGRARGARRLGIPPRARGQRGRARERAHVGPSLVAPAAHPARRLGPRGRAAGRADGQQRGRASQPRRGARGDAGPRADQRVHAQRRFLPQSGAAGRVRRREDEAAARCT